MSVDLEGELVVSEIDYLISCVAPLATHDVLC